MLFTRSSNRVLVILALLIGSLCLAPTVLAADSDADSFDDAIDVDDDGDGLIEISTLTHLDHIRNNRFGTAYNDGINGDDSTGCGNGTTVLVCAGYELSNDLDFNTDTSDAVQVIDSKDQFFNGGLGWDPIGGSAATGFNATFEGNGFTIHNLFINNNTGQVVGFFGYITTATIQNLNFGGDLTEVIGSANFHAIGTLVGFFRGTATNVHAKVNVGGINTLSTQVGGLIGFAQGASLNGLSTQGVINGNVNSVGNGATDVGGLIGRMQGGSLQDSWSSADVSGGSGSGGLIGRAHPFASSEAFVNRSFSTGSVTTTGTAGGFVASLTSFSTNTGSHLSDVFSTGAVSAPVVGGFVANFGGGVHTISNAYATGLVTDTDSVQFSNGFAGNITSSVTLADVYWDPESSGQTSSAGAAIAATTAQLQCPTSNSEDCQGGGALFANWPSNLWDFGVSIQYPALLINGLMQRDTDGDGVIDSLDSDDDGDGIADVSDLCPLDADASNANFDLDHLCDTNDLDDDNDGYSDIDENSNGGQSNPMNPVSTPMDNDNDLISDFNDPDDDNDGYTDIDELSNGGQSDPFNASSQPADQDGDFISDFLDDDDDNDTVPDVSDNCPLDADLDNINTDGDQFCDNNDPDDDNDGDLDGDDNCQFIANPDQANNDQDALGDLCDDNDDNDTVLDTADNCQFVFNSNQTDQDGDGFGNLCDLDFDGDRLIEIHNLTHLDAMRNSLDGSALNGVSDGCSYGATLTACNGFELNTNLDFNTDTSDAVQTIDAKDQFFNAGAGWNPVGSTATPFTGRFDGNARAINNLFINNSSDAEVGVFGYFAGPELKNVALQGELTQVQSSLGASSVGALAGIVDSTTVEDVNASVQLSGSAGSNLGGLFGQMNNATTLQRSFTTGSMSASGAGAKVGGLVGSVNGGASTAQIHNSVSDVTLTVEAGSLAGGIAAVTSNTLIQNAFSFSQIHNASVGAATLGALVADDGNSTVFTDSYWDSNIATQLGISSDGGLAKTTTQLQCNTDSTAGTDCEQGGNIFDNWQAQGWHFGASFQYPVLVFANRAQRDTDGDGLIDFFETDPDNDGFEFGDDNCPFDQDLANINSDDDDQCNARDLDDDNDGYTDADELDNGTSTTNAGDTPADNDGDFISDLNDNDDDNDGNLDSVDNCVFDADISNQNNDGDALCDNNDLDDDNDGLSDEQEIAAGLNPFVSNNQTQDTDGDGFSDHLEASVGSDVFDITITPLNAGAGFNDWNSTGPTGGALSGVYIDPSNADIAYASTNTDIYRTGNQGQVWERFTKSLLPSQAFTSFFGIAVDPNDSQTVYVSNRRNADRLLKTEDGGLTWNLRETGITVAVHDVYTDPFNSSVLTAIGTGGEVFRSSDAALTWSQVGTIPQTGFFLGDLHISRSNPVVMYSYSSDGVFVSSDGGATWAVVNNGFGANPSVSSITIDPSDSDVAYAAIASTGLFKTVDRGQNWVRVDTGTSVAGLFVQKLAIDANTPSTLYFSNGLTFYKSTNGGVNWSESAIGITFQSSGLNQIAVGTNDSSVIYATSGDFSAFVSNDSGLNWLQRNQGVDRRGIGSIARIPASNEVVVAAGSELGGVFKTRSAGNRWDKIGQGIGANVNGVAIDPSNPLIRYAGTANDIFKTTDGGESWAGLNVTVLGSFSKLLVDPQSSNLIYALSSGQGFVRSLDAGLTWSTAIVGLPAGVTTQISDIAALDNELYLSLSSDSSGVYKSGNNGALWAPVNNGSMTSATRVYGLSVDAQNSKIYAMVNTVPLVTSDAGGSWELLSGGIDAQNISVDQEATEILYSSNFGQVSRSIDFGQSWQDLPLITRPRTIRDIVTGPKGSSVVYAGTSNLGVQVIELATDLVLEGGVVESQIVEGVEFTYHFTINNNGPYHEHAAVFRQELPSSALSFVSATSSSGGCTFSLGFVNCDLGELKVGDDITVDITALPTRGGSLRSEVSASGYLSELTPEDSAFAATVEALIDTDGDEVPDIDDLNDDNDNFPDANDNCSLVANNDQANFDGDNFGDVCDLDDDGDGISDLLELSNGLNPLNPSDALQDFDGDGLNNRQEIALGTDIRDSDSDDDGRSDGDEVAAGTNPLRDESKPISISAIINLLLLD